MKTRIEYNYKQIGALGVYQQDVATFETSTLPTVDEAFDLLYAHFPGREHFCHLKIEEMKTVDSVTEKPALC
jgi:hypothetical protein